MRLILLPGLDGTGLLFTPLVQHLTMDIKTDVIAYPADHCLNYRDLEYFVREQLPKDDDFVLLGESFSGVIAYEIAKRPPENMKAVIFTASFIRSPIVYLRQFKFLPMGWLFKIPFPVYLLKKFMFGADVQPKTLVLFKKAMSAVSARVLNYRTKQAAFYQGALERLKIPSLYLQSKYDVFVPANNANLMLETIPDLKIVTLSCPHFLLQSRPAESARVIEAMCHNSGTASIKRYQYE